MLLVDPAAGAVKGTLATGYAPEFTLAPDGRTFYVVSGWAVRADCGHTTARAGACSLK